MMRGMMDFSSWQSILTTLAGILMFTMIAMGVRVLMMMTIQARQGRMNRQINERLRTLISAYRVLGGSFTGSLTVDPTHMGQLRRQLHEAEGETANEVLETPVPVMEPEVSSFSMERRVQIRDAVEGALADILLLGTEDHVRLAGQAALDMAEGRPIHTAELVVSLRRYIREALDLEDIPKEVRIPAQGPTRPSQGGGRGGKGGERGQGAGGGGAGGAGGGGGGAGGGGGGGMGMGLGMGLGRRSDDQTP